MMSNGKNVAQAAKTFKHSNPKSVNTECFYPESSQSFAWLHVISMWARSISLIAPIFRRLPTDRHVSFGIISSGIPGEPLQVLCQGPFVIVFELE
jgi:hypothetical protein